MRGYIQIVLLILVGISCSTNSEEIIIEVDYSIPETTNDGWQISAPEDENVDIFKLNEAHKLLKAQDEFRYIYTLTISKNGKLIFDEFYYDEDDRFKKGDPTFLQSVTKGYATLATGIAIDRGDLASVETSIQSLLPNLDHINWEGDKSKITLSHVLSMSAGLEGEDGGNTSAMERDSLRAMNYASYMFSKEVIHTPGEVFQYRTALTNTLRDILAVSIGDQNTSIDNYMREVVFSPLDIRSQNWISHNTRGHIHLGGGLMLAPRDMIKIGQLILNEGVWNGNQVVSGAWLKEATAKHHNVTGYGRFNGFGYNFWRYNFNYKGKEIPAIISAGTFGQYIVTFPEQEVVVSISSWFPDNINSILPLEFLEDHLLEALFD